MRSIVLGVKQKEKLFQLGSEQSGHIQGLGEEFYFEILNEQLKKQEEVFIEPEIQLPVSVGIPSTYIPDSRLRLLYYKSLSESLDKEERLAIQNELLEEFGVFPPELQSLFFSFKYSGVLQNKKDSRF